MSTRAIDIASWRRHYSTGILTHVCGLAVGLFALALVVADNRHFILLLYAAFGFVAMMFALDIILANGRMSFPWILRLYMAFAVYALISVLWTRNPEIAMTRGGTIATIALALPILAHLLQFRTVRRYTLVSLAIALCVIAGILSGVLHYPGEIWSESGRFQGTFVLATNMAKALFLVAATAFLIFFADPAKLVRRVAVASLLLAFLLTLPTMSRAGVVTIGVLMLGLLLTSVRLTMYMTALSTVAAIVISLWYQGELFDTVASGLVERMLPLITLDIEAGTSADLRKAAITEALRMFAENPIGGAGLASVESVQGYYAHNAWADIGANLGLIGITLWIGMYLLLVKAIYANSQARLRWAGYVVLMAVFLFELADAFYLSRTGMLSILLLYVFLKSAPAGDIKTVPEREIE
jgi:O-antigen ligase